MSKIEPGSFEDNALAHSAVAKGHPVFDQDWKERLKTARAKRNVVLSQRKADVPPTSSVVPSPEKHDRSELAVAPSGAEVQAGETVEGHSDLLQKAMRSQPIYKLLLAFSAATGIGLGVTLGLGALSVFGGPEKEGMAPLFVAAGLAPANPIAASPTAGSSDVMSPSGIWQVPVLTENPTVSGTFPGNLPQIEAVQYVSASGAPAEDTWTLTVPPNPALPDNLTAAGTLSGLTPRFFVHAPEGVPEGRLQAYVAQFQSEGIEVGSIGRESFRVSATHLRYFSPEVADAARSAADALGVEARDFSQNGLQTGRIEIWIAGRPKPTAHQASPGDNVITRLFGRLTQASN